MGAPAKPAICSLRLPTGQRRGRVWSRLAICRSLWFRRPVGCADGIWGRLLAYDSVVRTVQRADAIPAHRVRRHIQTLSKPQRSLAVDDGEQWRLVNIADR